MGAWGEWAHGDLSPQEQYAPRPVDLVGAESHDELRSAEPDRATEEGRHCGGNLVIRKT